MSQKFDKKTLAMFQNWRDHPAAMVQELFQVRPDPWQANVLECFPHRPLISMQACKGPGKTCVLAWMMWNFLLTRPDPKVAATSISGDNLKDNLWSELALWRSKAPLLQATFEWTTTRIMSRQRPETWWASARTWPKSGDISAQANTLAGLHSDFILFVLDESGGIPSSVMVSAEAALSSCVEGHIVQAGNPTHLEGPLYRASKDRLENGGRWQVFEITGDPDDPMRSPRVKVEWAREQIKEYGIDSPWVTVNVFGRFPAASLTALIGEDEVRDAMKRVYREVDLTNYARILAADVARQGDDASVIARRRGLVLYPFKKFRNLTGIEGASITNRTWNEFGADACFIDGTGGFGFTWVDQLSNLGRTAIPIGFGDEARDPVRFENRRAEMAFGFVEWIKAGGALPNTGPGVEELVQSLIRTTYGFKKGKDRLILEPKEDVKAKLGYSPDEMDAAMLTFAEPVTAKVASPFARPSYNATTAYQPFAELDRMVQLPVQGAVSPYNPYGDR